MLQCDNLLFRRPELKDATALLALKNNEKAARLLGGIHHEYTLLEMEKWVKFHNDNPNEVLLVVEDKASGKIIGHVGLYKIDRVSKKTEYGILIADDDSRGKGYGTKCTQTLVNYAFNVLDMHKVTAEVLTENTPSVAMFKKCGFVVDGCLRDDIFKNGRFYDVFCMSIIRD